MTCSSNIRDIILYVDKHKYSITAQEDGYSIYKNITLPKGQHFVKIIVDSENEWCSNPSKGTGFESGRYLFSWTEGINDMSDLYIRSGLYIILFIIMVSTDEIINGK